MSGTISPTLPMTAYTKKAPKADKEKLVITLVPEDWNNSIADSGFIFGLSRIGYKGCIAGHG